MAAKWRQVGGYVPKSPNHLVQGWAGFVAATLNFKEIPSAVAGFERKDL